MSLKIKLPPLLLSLTLFCCGNNSHAQNSLVGDGFGGRSWYVPYNYQVGSYFASTVCLPDSQLYVWGGNNTHVFANITMSNSDTGVAVTGMNHVKFSSMGYMAAAIKADSTAWVWGFYFSPTTPEMMLNNVKFVDAGAYHVVFVKYDGTVWGAGSNGSGQLGTGTVDDFISTPVQMLGINNAVRAVAVGYGSGYNDPSIDFHGATVILLSDGTVKITGGYPWFTPDSSNVAVTIPGLTNIVDIKGNAMAAYALNASGEVYSFGTQTADLNYGTLGIGPFAGGYHAPSKITFPVGAAPIIALSACDDGEHAFALDENGNLYGWGYSNYGQLGSGTSSSNVNVPVLCASNVVDIHAGETFSYIIKADHTLWASGHGIFGNLFMNLNNDFYYTFVQLDPTGPFMHLCPPVIHGVLPVKLADFSVSRRNNSAHIRWQSSMEDNLKNYLLEYSEDARHFKAIASIKAKGAAASYNQDHLPNSKLAFYRLKMIDNDGQYQYSEIRSVKFGDPAYFTIAPNPVGKELNIHDISNADIKSIQVISMKGETLKHWDGAHIGQGMDISTLAPSVYIIKLVTKTGDVKLQKFVKL